MIGDLQATVASGSLALAVPVALLAGLVSFLSPCVLPLVPGFLGYVTGMSGSTLEQQRRSRLVAGAALFVAGFTAVYLVLGYSFGAVGNALAEHQWALRRVLGALVIGMGLLFLLEPSWAQREARLRWRPRAGLAGAPVLGAVFGFGWVPCSGPVLATIGLLSVDSGTSGRGAALAVAYSLGLGVPFLLVALAFGRSMRALDVLRRHRVAINRFGGVLLLVVGTLLVTDTFDVVTNALREPFGSFETVI
ncbi:cytochrome c-type biogenesis protein [Kineococcus xinjiangensis]|uniref:Cytochrome c-type biogenesis protein n=1 Tax=Kineococcus xinjiangensis TaxID=512762 RepID=A0A2S6IH18_9ACTN|nr:cytochrome c biogenesis protein CcdA [Kineococcus xinjiangensis]PPK93514.1 cytochrome c-type biogenesis protein [Kineococcus xinjiangensis]